MPAAHVSDPPPFAFGTNWQSFVRTALDDTRIATAAEALQRLLRLDQLHGRSFLDVGCGSGLSSLAALTLGAQRVVAFDSDPNSVAASAALRSRAGIPEDRWRILQGSVLDGNFLAALERTDVVYAWGVLHHTGAMWQAVDHTVRLVKPGGLLALAIYNNVERRIGGSAHWWRIKRRYNRSSQPLQRLMEYAYVLRFGIGQLVTGRNPVAAIRRYDGAGRGMDFWHDVRDWLGGFPYEYATAGDVFNYVHATHGLDLVYLNTHDGHGCNECTFGCPGR